MVLSHTIDLTLSSNAIDSVGWLKNLIGRIDRRVWNEHCLERRTWRSGQSNIDYDHVTEAQTHTRQASAGYLDGEHRSAVAGIPEIRVPNGELRL